MFDLGETLVDETENWGRWADHLGVPRLTFAAALGAVIAGRRPHTDVFELLGASVDTSAVPWRVSARDLYPDALPTLAALRTDGYRLAVMANQPASVSPFLHSLPVDLVATSAEWGVAKPDPLFFERVLSAVGAEAARVAYVGDRVDNDVLPSKAAGMVAVHVRRGPWGVIQSAWPEASSADLRLADLGGLVAGLASLAR